MADDRGSCDLPGMPCPMRLSFIAAACCAAFCAAACSDPPVGTVCAGDDDCGALSCIESAAERRSDRCTPGNLVCTRTCERLDDCDDDEVCVETCTAGVRICLGTVTDALPFSAVCDERSTCVAGLGCMDNFTASICSRPCIDDGDCVGLDPDVLALCNSNAVCVAAGS